MIRRIVIALSLLGAFSMPAAAQGPTSPHDQRILDAAEHFEAITEQAYSKNRDALSSDFKTAEVSINTVADDLSTDGKADVTAALGALRTALTSGTPPEIAIASVEVYRSLVTEISASHAVPKEVSLLDYSGFKIDASVKAESPDWEAIGAALDFADKNWETIANRVGDSGLRERFAASLTSLRASIADRDVPRIKSDAALELALVDDLEKYFSAK